MKMAKNEILKHILTLAATIAVISLCIVNPYLPGEYDRLAMPLSIVVQSFGLTGLILTWVGLLWLMMPQRHSAFANIALYLSTMIVLFLAFLSLLTARKVIGVIIVVPGRLPFFVLKKNLVNRKTPDKIISVSCRYTPAKRHLQCRFEHH